MTARHSSAGGGTGHDPDRSRHGAVDSTQSTPAAGSPSASAAGTGSDDPDVMSPAAGASPSDPAGSVPITKGGHGNRSGRWTCRCSHSRIAHTRQGHCTACATCDRFRPPPITTNDGAAPDRATPS